VKLITVLEVESFYVNSPSADITGLELPVEFERLESGFGYVVISDFLDNELLTIQLWERMIQDLNQFDIPGLIIDLRVNGGGNGYLADQMAAYFFDGELISGNTAFYDDSIDEFYADPGDENILFPPREELRFHGPVVVIVGPACASACEFFAYDLTLEDRATIVGRYPTADLGGSVEDFQMPEGVRVRFTIGRTVDPEGNIHVEGRGVKPDVSIILTEGSFYAEYRDGRDFLLEEAIKVISRIR
jgi:carboxyl-terminal processing protease